MGRDIAGRRRRGRPAVAALLLGAALGLAGCGSAVPSAGSGAPAAGSPGSLKQASSGRSRDPLAHSPLRVLTTLDSVRLCAALSAAEASRILGAAAQRPAYGVIPKLGIYCRWLKDGVPASNTTDELYVGISSVIGWAGTQQVDRLLHARPARIDGHPALAAAPHGPLAWAQVDVALGGANDPVAEYRAPTMAMARRMAATATPHIIAMG